MDKWLHFLSTEVSSAFMARETKIYSYRLYQMLLLVLLAQISYLIFQVVQISLPSSPDEHDYHLYMLIYSVSSLSITLALLFLSKNKILSQRLCKYAAFMATFLELTAVYELFFSFGFEEVYHSPLDCGITYLQIILIAGALILSSRWYMRAIIIFCCSSYVLLRNANSYTVSVGVCNAIICIIITISLTLGLYWFEKQSKKNFLRNYQASTQEKILKSLLDGLPEGIMIMDKNQKPIYENQAMHVVLNTESNQEAILAKIKALHLDEILEDIEHINEKGLLDDSMPYQQQFTLSVNKKTLNNESPNRTEMDSPGFEPINKRRRSKGKETPSHAKSLKPPPSSKTYLWPSQPEYSESYRTRGNTSSVGSPTKKNSDHSRVRFREESFHSHSQEQVGSPQKGKIWKKLSSSIYPIETSFRKEFNEDQLKGYAVNPAIAQDYILFNFYGEYFKNGKDNVICEDDSHHFAYEVKIRHMVMEGQEYKVLIITDISIREKLANSEANSKYKTLMFATLSHELRTPLNGVHSMLEVAIKHMKDADITQQYLMPALINAQMLKFLVNDMLDYSKILAKKLILTLNSFPIKECIQEIVDIMQPQVFIKNLFLDFTISNQVPKKLHSDKARIQQILVNLLSNATKFTSQGGISVFVDVDPSRVNVLKISVQDTGIGLKEADKFRLDRVIHQFDTTERVSSSSSGMGLGLMISQSIALALGPPGSEELSGIQIRSEYGKGSEFEFTVYNHNISGTLEEMISISSLPDERSPETIKAHFLTTKFNPKLGIQHILQVEKRPQKSSRKIIIDTTCSCKKVLIVDDTPYNVLAIQAQLKAMGIESEATYNGEEAIKKVCEESKAREICCQGYSLIFMDFNMPVLDGYEATRKIKLKIARKEISDVPIIGCTAYTDKDLLDQGLRSGMDEYITKPVTSKILQKILKKYEIID